MFFFIQVLGTNSSLAQISLPISTSNGAASTNNITVGSMVFPLGQSMNSVSQSQGVIPVTIATVPVSLANYTTDHLITATSSPQTSQHRSNVVITEVTSDRDSQEENDSAGEMQFPPAMNRRNSMSTAALMANKEFISRQVSDASKSSDSPSLPKRNQPITSSAPSTLTKTKAEQKTGEVYV